MADETNNTAAVPTLGLDPAVIREARALAASAT